MKQLSEPRTVGTSGAGWLLPVFDSLPEIPGGGTPIRPVTFRLEGITFIPLFTTLDLSVSPPAEVVEDVKAIRTEVYRLKALHMRAQYGLVIREIGPGETLA